mgnify:CR=1 FL=1
MSHALPGQRLSISDDAEIVIRFGGRESDRIALAAISDAGRPIGLERLSTSDWRLPSASQHGSSYELVAYITDDRMGGFVNASYPCSVTIGGTQYAFPEPAEQLAAVILGEVYIKNGQRRLKVSNEGFTFGIEAFARNRNLGNVEFPFRASPAPSSPPAPPTGSRRNPWDQQNPPPAPSGQPLASGSGVLVGDNLVITNAHVIEDGQSFHLARTREALIPLAVDPMHDLALLQGNVTGTPLPIRLNSPVWLGESVMAAGYPLREVLGGDLKVTTGNISGLTGGLGDVSRFQFSAPIGSGSSGGAIIDESGNLIGITSASLAHQNFRDRGSISENVNFGVRASLVFELIAAAGMPLPQTAIQAGSDRREVTNRLRNSVVSIMVNG